MSELVRPLAEWSAAIIEILGVALIAFTAISALFGALYQWFRGSSIADNFDATRKQLGRGILLGLEFLVAADIIHTVAVELTFTTVGVLAVIVLIRTFLSFTLDLELTGRWPWQEDRSIAAPQQRDIVS